MLNNLCRPFNKKHKIIKTLKTKSPKKVDFKKILDHFYLC